jgi:GntR family transcriptional regulator
MFVLPGAVEQLRVAERDRFVTEHWPKIRDHAALLGVDLTELIERETA